MDAEIIQPVPLELLLAELTPEKKLRMTNKSNNEIYIFIYENMKENGHMIGGEQSGHVIFRKYAHTGDGILTAIMLMEVVLATNLPLSVLASGCEMYPQVLKNVVVDDKDGTLADPAVQAQVDACTADLGDNGRVLLRKSGTEPVLRVMAEAGTLEECEKQVDAIIEAMNTSGHLVEVKK